MAFKLNDPTDPPSGSSNATAEELRQKRIDARKALEAERKRVTDIRSRIDEVAESAAGGSYTVNYGVSDGRTGILGAGVVPQKTYEWLQSAGGAGCSTYACGIMREAGVTVPNSVGEEGVTINNVTYKPGDKMPIIPGNEQFDALAPQLGFELRAPGSLPNEGDVTRVGYGYGTTSHSTIQVGDGESVYNPGTPSSGLKKSTYYSDPKNFEAMSEQAQAQFLRDSEDYEGFYNNPVVGEDEKIYSDRLMQYVGDLPALRKKYREAAQASPDEAINLKPKGIDLSSLQPTAQLPTNMLKFFNRNK